MRLLLVITITLLYETVRGQSFGSFVAQYAPILNSNEWFHLPLVAYISTSNIWHHPKTPGKAPTLALRRADDSDFTILILRSPQGRVFKTYCDSAPSPFSEEIYSGDFNGDSIPDFMVVKPGSGCGLAAEYCTGIFAFSEGTDYRFTRIRTMGLGPHNLVLRRQDKTLRLIHTTFRSGKAKDGRYHSFWVHRFFEWNGVAFRQDDTRQPVWIQYLYRANRVPTRLLTPMLKASIWAEDKEADPGIEW